MRARRGEAEAFVAYAAAYAGGDCLLWPFGRNGPGYGAYRDGYAHVEVCERVHGPRPSCEHEAAHRCGVKLCVSGRHVRWLKIDAHMAEGFELRERPVGEQHHNTKLTAQQVDEIRASPLGSKRLAKVYPVSARYIRKIRAGQIRTYEDGDT